MPDGTARPGRRPSQLSRSSASRASRRKFARRAPPPPANGADRRGVPALRPLYGRTAALRAHRAPVPAAQLCRLTGLRSTGAARLMRRHLRRGRPLSSPCSRKIRPVTTYLPAASVRDGSHGFSGRDRGRVRAVRRPSSPLHYGCRAAAVKSSCAAPERDVIAPIVHPLVFLYYDLSMYSRSCL